MLLYNIHLRICSGFVWAMVILLLFSACRHKAEKPKEVKATIALPKRKRVIGNAFMQRYVDYCLNPRYFEDNEVGRKVYMDKLGKVPVDSLYGFVVIPDTFFYKPLNTTVYYADEPGMSHAPVVMLIRDNTNDQIYVHEIPTWGYDGTESIFSPQEALRFFEDNRLMPCNPSYSDIESYFNRCIALRDKRLTNEMLDTILAPAIFAVKVNAAEELDRRIRKTHDQKYINTRPTQKFLRLIKHKMRTGEGRVYAREYQSLLIYVDYTPEIIFNKNKKETWSEARKKGFTQHFMGSNYKLRIIFIRL